MTKGINQKLKMLYLEKIFQRETDDEHGLTLQEITERLNKDGVNADRKTLYRRNTVWISSVPTADGTAPTIWEIGSSSWPS